MLILVSMLRVVDAGTTTVEHAELVIAASNAGPSSDPLAVNVHDEAATPSVDTAAPIATFTTTAVKAKRVRRRANILRAIVRTSRSDVLIPFDSELKLQA